MQNQPGNGATLLAFFVLVAIAIGLILLVAAVLPKAIWIVVVIAGFVLAGLLNYLTWGRWLLRQPPPEDDPD